MAYNSVTVKQIQHKQVVGLSGEKLGVIEDVVMGAHDGTFSHVILRHGGFLGFGGTRYAFPFSALTICAENRQCRLDINDYELDEFPSLEGSDYSGLHDPFKRRVVHGLLGGDFTPADLDFVKQR
jgi:sporulation protein YlmC with PRC-barrel domain